MYYELAILGRLMYAPYHGYLIIHVISEMIGPWQKVSPGTLYPLLARLEQDGLVEAAGVAEGGARSRRTARVFTISAAGRARFRELMLDTATSIGEYQRLFYLKVPHLRLLTLDEQLQIVEHYRDYCRAALRHQERITRELEQRQNDPAAEPPAVGGASRASIAHGLLVTRHQIEQWRAELAWAGQLAAHVTEGR